MANTTNNSNQKTNTNEETFPIGAVSAKDDKKLTAIVTANLKTLIEQNGLTQKELAEKVGFCEAAVCKYFRGNQFPPIDFLFNLKKLYGISIDDFLSRKMIEPVENKEELEMRKAHELLERNLYKKYCGNYMVYYLDTSNYKGRDSNTPAESLVYGVINIHEVETNLDKPEFESVAFLGIDSREEAEKIKESLDSLSSMEEIAKYVHNTKGKNGQNNIYTGDFEFGAKHAYITLKHENIDKALIILYRVDTNKSVYNGGLGVINSGSKGREKMPTAQFMALSRYSLSLSPEEIHHELLLSHPTFKADEEIKNLIAMFKNTYLTNDSSTSLFSDYQKELMLKAYLEDNIKKIITRNMDRYAKASERDDSNWYKLIKKESIKYHEQHNLPADKE